MQSPQAVRGLDNAAVELSFEDMSQQPASDWIIFDDQHGTRHEHFPGAAMGQQTSAPTIRPIERCAAATRTSCIDGRGGVE